MLANGAWHRDGGSLSRFTKTKMIGSLISMCLSKIETNPILTSATLVALR
jgi:hypothetical protein